MKISKLFHWLYGILMLLPILVFIPNAFYYGFNEQAIAQEKTEQVPIYYETNEVNSVDDIILDNLYQINFTGQTFSSDFSLLLSKCFIVGYSTKVNGTSGAYTDTPYFVINANGDVIYGSSDNNPTNIIYTNLISYVVIRYINPNTIDRLIPIISEAPNNIVKEYQPLTTTMSITDSMSYAWDSVWQNDLFSWSYESFLSEPFKYIGNVFGLPNDNSIYYCLSYWLDISIIWLCFDLIMYVPLLVHRWIDKGVIE